MARRLVLPLVLFSFAAMPTWSCDDDDDSSGDGGADADADSDSDSDTDGDGDSDGDGDGDGDGDADPDGGGVPCDQECGQWQHCENGECICDWLFTQCDGQCVRLGTHEHCARCGDACAEDDTCVGGVCTPPCGGPCPDDGTCCDDRCRDTDTDSQHCGFCDNACQQGEACYDGVCSWGKEF